MGKSNRKCIVCGTEYEYCPTCRSMRTLPKWKTLYDTENCKTIFEVTSDYAQHAISKEEAAKRLKECDLSKQYSFTEAIRNVLREVLYSTETIDEVTKTETQDAEQTEEKSEDVTTSIKKRKKILSGI